MYLLISPYTKIEERMNLHGIHDIIFFGINKNGLKNYDHFIFPCVVPRTFIGALLIAGITSLLKLIIELFFKELTKPCIEILVRGILGIYTSIAIIIYRHKIIKHYGHHTGLWFGIFQASQFHIMYYASRTLPNIFAFGICTLTMTCFIGDEKKKIPKSLSILTFTAVVFRSEIFILIIAYALYFWVHNIIKISKIIKACIWGGVIGLFCTILVDSWFWQKFLLWPEGAAFWFNIIQGKSSQWGVSAWHIYFSKYIPKLLLNPLSFILWGISFFTYTKDTINLLIPSITFVLIYSLIPHKEWRFIIYIIPSLTLVNAIGATWICRRRHKSQIFMIMFFILIIATIITFFASIAISLVSSLNYPGGYALKILHDFNLLEGERIHLDVYTRMTGATLFSQNNGKIIYDRTENEAKLNDYNFLKTIDWAISDASTFKLKGNWHIKKVIKGYSGIKKEYFYEIYTILPKLWYPKIKVENKIWILKNDKGLNK
ncbi:hypothetical protein PCANB_001515 [Pneumocystis canis]|nr:hypothetical protein PCANB_001515 [Pneumocystis canis]